MIFTGMHCDASIIKFSHYFSVRTSELNSHVFFFCSNVTVPRTLEYMTFLEEAFGINAYQPLSDSHTSDVFCFESLHHCSRLLWIQQC